MFGGTIISRLSNRRRVIEKLRRLKAMRSTKATPKHKTMRKPFMPIASEPKDDKFLFTEALVWLAKNGYADKVLGRYKIVGIPDKAYKAMRLNPDDFEGLLIELSRASGGYIPLTVKGCKSFRRIIAKSIRSAQGSTKDDLYVAFIKMPTWAKKTQRRLKAASVKLKKIITDAAKGMSLRERRTRGRVINSLYKALPSPTRKVKCLLFTGKTPQEVEEKIKLFIIKGLANETPNIRVRKIFIRIYKSLKPKTQQAQQQKPEPETKQETGQISIPQPTPKPHMPQMEIPKPSDLPKPPIDHVEAMPKPQQGKPQQEHDYLYAPNRPYNPDPFANMELAQRGESLPPEDIEPATVKYENVVPDFPYASAEGEIPETQAKGSEKTENKTKVVLGLSWTAIAGIAAVAGLTYWVLFKK